MSYFAKQLPCDMAINNYLNIVMAQRQEQSWSRVFAVQLNGSYFFFTRIYPWYSRCRCFWGEISLTKVATLWWFTSWIPA